MYTIVFGLVKVTKDDIIKVTFKNGEQKKGHIIFNDKDGFTIKVKQEKIKITPSEIKYIKKLGKVKKYDSNYNWLK